MILAFLISTYFMVTNRNLYYYVTTDRNNCPLTCLLKQASCLARLPDLLVRFLALPTNYQIRGIFENPFTTFLSAVPWKLDAFLSYKQYSLAKILIFSMPSLQQYMRKYKRPKERIICRLFSLDWVIAKEL